jgi:hypothetical protein
MAVAGRDSERLRMPETELHREVFLDDHRSTQNGVFGEIGDAEPARAENPQNFEFLKTCAGWQRLACVFLFHGLTVFQ